MQLYVCFLLALLSVVSISNSDAAEYCTPTTTASGKAKPNVDYSYITEVVNKDVVGRQIYASIHAHDATTNTVSFRASDVRWTYGSIWNTKTQYAITYDDSSCKSYQPNNITTKERALELIYNLKGPWVYQGQKTLRGISLDYWSSCTKGTWITYNADYYFMEDGTPFRLEMKGMTKDATKIDYHTIIDYFKFTKGKPDPKYMKVPPGVVCPGEYKKPNPLPISASYRMEQVLPLEKGVMSQQVVYDKARKASITRRDGKSTIRDFNRGVQFDIGKDGKCTRSVLPRVGNPDEIEDAKGNVHMATLDQFLLGDVQFTYNGQETVRGIPCDVYTKRGRSAESAGSTTSIIIYMAQEKVNMHNNVGYYSTAVNPPVRIRFMGGKPSTVIRQIEIYDFDAEEYPSVAYPFDLTPCYNGSSQIHFTLTVQAPRNDVFYETIEKVQGRIITNLTKVLDLPALRVQPAISFSREVENNQWLVEGIFFARENTGDKFTEKVDTYQPLSKGEDSTTYDNPSNTPAVCAEYCITVAKRPFTTKTYCESFSFNRATKTCIFMYNWSFKNDTQKSYIVDLYKRTYASYDYNSLESVWNKLVKEVAAGSISYTDKDENGKVLGVYKAIKAIRQYTNDSEPRNPPEDDPSMKHFLPIMPGYYLTESPVETVVSVTQRICALRCFRSLKYFCKAFHFTSVASGSTCNLFDNDKNSAMSQYQKDKAKKNKEPNSIDISEIRNLLESFQVIPGKTLLYDTSDYVYTHINIHGCAELCARSTQINCNSFDTCDDVCMLSSHHMYNVPSANLKVKKECMHFSRIHVLDYVKIPNKKQLANTNVIQVKQIGVEQCAHLCSTSSDYDCNVFEYCDSSAMCLVYAKAVPDTSSLTYKSTGTCDLYKRRRGIHRAVSQSGQASTSKNTAAGPHSAGSMAGIAIGMIILGCLMLIIIGTLIFKFRTPGGGGGGDSVGFSQRQLSESE